MRYDLAKIEQEQTRRFLALLETVNFGNVVDPYLKRAYNIGGQVIEGLGSLVNQGIKRAVGKPVDLLAWQIPRAPVVELDKKVAEHQAKLDRLSDEELTERLRQALTQKLKPQESDDSSIVRQAALVAAKGYGIKNAEFASTPRLVRLVHDHFLEDMLSKSAKQLSKMDQAALAKVEREIEAGLQQLDQEILDELREALRVQALTGKAVTSALIKGLQYGSFVGLIELSGFSAYVALSTIVHAIFTTALGITLPFAVYTGLSSFVAFITADEDPLSSGLKQRLLPQDTPYILCCRRRPAIKWTETTTPPTRYAIYPLLQT